MHVVVYDINDDAIRHRIASLLEGFGRRVQESVFECAVDERQLREMTERLRKELRSEDKGQVRIYRVCAGCVRASFGLGTMKPVDTGQCFIV